jgi:hypothetical protein
MMRGIRRLVVYAAATGLLAAAAVSTSMEVAHADTPSCNGDAGSKYACNLLTTSPIPDPSSISVTLSDQDTETIGINYTVSCGSQIEQGGVTASVMPGTPVVEDLTPLPANASDSQCDVTAQVDLPPGTDVIDYDFTATLNYTSSASASPTPGGTNAAVHPVKGYSGMCLDDKGNSSANRTKILIWKCSSTDQAQSWKFSGDELIHNGKCVNDQANAGSGGHLILYTCSGAANDHWSELANGELKLQSHNGTLCVNDPGYSKKNGTQLIVYTCTDSANEKWSLP